MARLAAAIFLRLGAVRRGNIGAFVLEATRVHGKRTAEAADAWIAVPTLRFAHPAGMSGPSRCTARAGDRRLKGVCPVFRGNLC